MLGNDGLKIMTRQINNKKHETGEWSMNFNEITKIALKKEAKRCKMQLTSHIQHRE
jgi:hypothetical protein